MSTCNRAPHYVSRNVALDLACTLGINLNVISLEQWRDALNKEVQKNWNNYCHIVPLAEEVRDNLLDNINYYQNLGLGNTRIVNTSIVNDQILCELGTIPNEYHLDYTF